jgi:hypothetical protein
MQTTKLTASKAIELLKDIPEEDFITDRFTDKQGKCCAIGHLQRLTSQNPTNYSQNNCSDRIEGDIRIASNKYLTEAYNLSYESIASVNNENTINGYNENTPKQRVLHLLEDMVKAGY